MENSLSLKDKNILITGVSRASGIGKSDRLSISTHQKCDRAFSKIFNFSQRRKDGREAANPLGQRRKEIKT